MKLKPKIGLEIHTEVKTKSKMFCSCPNVFASEPNIYICPICTGQPGALPTINKKAVELTLKLGKALGGKINTFTYFVRKNYYYPDLPKNYQISQYELPLIEGGEVKFFLDGQEKVVYLRRIHLEEDAGRLIHLADASLVDFNRAGTPLIEIVTQPCLESSQEAKAFAEELILILRYLQISEANPEKGQIRFEANISVAPEEELGTRVEVKNLNSLRSLKDAIDYEIQRQIELLTSGKKVDQETRGWDEVHKKTFIQRTKEEAEDYRYFPEPDLVPLKIDDWIIDKPKTPFELRQEIVNKFNLTLKEVEILIWEPWALEFFVQAASQLPSNLIKTAFNYLVTDIFSLVQIYGQNKIKVDDFVKLIFLLDNKEISSKIIKNIFHQVFEGQPFDQILKIYQKIDDPEKIKEILLRAIEMAPQAKDDFLKGKANAFEFLIGQAMKISQGKIDPTKAREILNEILKNYF